MASSTGVLSPMDTHGHPCVRVEHVGILACDHGVGHGGHGAPVLLRDPLGIREDLGVGHPDLGAACDHVHPHDGAGQQQGVTNVVTITEVDELPSLESALLLLDGDHVGQCLTGVLQVIETADDRDLRVLRKGQHDLVVEGAVHDPVDKSAHDVGGVLHGLAVSELHLARVQIKRVSSELGDTDVEGDPGAGAGLLEDHGQRLSLEGIAVVAALGLQLDGEVDELGHVVLHIEDGNDVSFNHAGYSKGPFIK